MNDPLLDLWWPCINVLVLLQMHCKDKSVPHFQTKKPQQSTNFILLNYVSNKYYRYHLIYHCSILQLTVKFNHCHSNFGEPPSYICHLSPLYPFSPENFLITISNANLDHVIYALLSQTKSFLLDLSKMTLLVQPSQGLKLPTSSRQNYLILEFSF